MAPLKDVTFNSPLNIVAEREGTVIFLASMHPNGDTEKRIANARLLAASWATAAERDKLRHDLITSGNRRVELLDERDRLKVALQQAEEGVAVIVGQISAPQDGLSPETTAWVVRQAIAVSDRARAALDEARKP